jgi:hypothetical protein
MARTPAQIDALPDYTNAQMAKLWRNLIAELGSDPEVQTMGPNNRSYTLRNLDEAQRMLLYWEGRAAIDAEAAGAQGCPTVRFVEAPA